MERALSPQARLEAREQGARLHPLDRALALLRLAAPDADGNPAQLPLGERDRRLLAHRRATFGDRIACLADCPACGSTLEFELSAEALLRGAGETPPEEILQADGWRIRLRPLHSADLAAAACEGTSERAAAALVARAIVETIAPDGESGSPLPSQLLPLVENRIAEREAVAELTLDLACIDCGAGWTAGFDIGAHFWSEVEADARRLLAEVATLAARFGWSEAELLAMSPARRHAYLELVQVS